MILAAKDVVEEVKLDWRRSFQKHAVMSLQPPELFAGLGFAASAA
jgi:hypothetical protein